jgi:hypothetical protein
MTGIFSKIIRKPVWLEEQNEKTGRTNCMGLDCTGLLLWFGS